MRTPLIAALLLTCASGCSMSRLRYGTIETTPGYARVHDRMAAQSPPPAATPETSGRAIAIVVRAPNRLLTANSRVEPAVFRAVAGPEAPDEALPTVVDRIRAEQAAPSVIVIEDVGRTLVEALREQLCPRFGRCSVTLAGAEAAPNAIPVDFDLIFDVNGYARRKTTVRLAAATLGVSVEGSAGRSTAGHLGWAIPVMIIGGIAIGGSIAILILGGINRRANEDSVAGAIYDAARALSLEVARVESATAHR
jgi:hypothetical protein